MRRWASTVGRSGEIGSVEEIEGITFGRHANMNQFETYSFDSESSALPKLLESSLLVS
jgi:hypothetical protein